MSSLASKALTCLGQEWQLVEAAATLQDFSAMANTDASPHFSRGFGCPRRKWSCGFDLGWLEAGRIKNGLF
jgi:hypothetical protein